MFATKCLSIPEMLAAGDNLLQCTSMRQVFLSYGPLPSLRALLFYGFALEDNPHDTLALTFEARPGSDVVN